jgi:hypothetical protein
VDGNGAFLFALIKTIQIQFRLPIPVSDTSPIPGIFWDPPIHHPEGGEKQQKSIIPKARKECGAAGTEKVLIRVINKKKVRNNKNENQYKQVSG